MTEFSHGKVRGGQYELSGHNIADFAAILLLHGFEKGVYSIFSATSGNCFGNCSDQAVWLLN